ncbi:choline dehydrogenase [Xylariaceae sp. FL1651]|nr:choline dehydrogenase [Xylariaceae sp. FL1651]
MARALISLGQLVPFMAITVASIPNVVAKVNYVVVGGGPAGFVVAEQLSRNPKVTVTLLEAGGDYEDNADVNIPAWSPLNPDKAWFYYSEPDPNLGGLTPNVAQGKGFGGGTAINALGYCRGAASVFDEWADISGNPGLAWKSLLHDFEATTHYTFQPAGYDQFVNETVFGSGPIEISRSSFLTGLEIPFTSALKSVLDLPEVSTVDGTGIGVDLSLGTIRVSNRTRSYARNTFGWMMADRPNVQLLPNSWVQQIGFNGNTAKDVTYINTMTNETKTVEATEVILAGGAINSPKLLMQSGVGPAEVLTSLGINVVADIPEIGKNLWDHHYSYIEFQVTDDIYTWWQIMTNATESAIAPAQYAQNGAGPLGSNNGEAYGALRLPDSAFGEGIDATHYLSLPSDRPHVLYEFSTVPFRQPAPNVSIAAAWVALVQPEASGYLTINSSSYVDAPLVYSNYYGSAADKAAVQYAYKQLRGDILESEFMRPYRIREVWPGSNVTTDDQIWAAIQQSASSFHHPMGTIALGTVVDEHWRIKGLKGIRVVDSSTLPKMPTCHPQASIYAVAHRAARDIVRDDRIGGCSA